MCDPVIAPLILGAAIFGTQALTSSTPKIDMNALQSYAPQEAPQAAQMAPEAPMATPVMTTQGQEQAQDEQKATEQRVRKNRQGRNILRIDRTLPNNSGLAGGSGVNVPTG